MFDVREVLKRLVFVARGNQVVFKNRWYLSAGDPVTEAPEEILLVAQPIGSNYGPMMSGAAVAQHIVSLLNSGQEGESE